MEWDFGDGAIATTTSAQKTFVHEYAKTGTYVVILTPLTGGKPQAIGPATLSLVVEPGPLSTASLDTGAVTLSPQGIHAFSVEAQDKFGNPIDEPTFVFRANSKAGQIDDQGNFTAGTTAGTYQGGVTVEVSHLSGTKSLQATITVEPGPLAKVTLEPSSAEVEVAQGRRFSAQVADEFGNPLSGLTTVFKTDRAAGEIDASGNFTAATLAGVYQSAVTVEVSQGSTISTDTADVTLTPGPLDRVTLEPSSLSLEVAESTDSTEFTAAAFDQFDNTITGVDFQFQTRSAAGEIDDQGNFTASTKAGIYEDGVTVQVTQGATSKSAAALVTLEPGSLAGVIINPPSIELDIGDSVTLAAQGADAFGNPIPGAQIAWEVSKKLRTLADGRILTTGTLAGTFENGVKATATLGDLSAQGAATVTVNPGPLSSVVIVPVEVSVEQSTQLKATAKDVFNNIIPGVLITWRVVNDNIGTVTEDGVLTAGKVAATISKALEATAVQGNLVRTARKAVTVTPGPLDRVVIGPGRANLGMGMSQQFVAVGADVHGNRILELNYTWDVEEGGGAIDVSGLFTAGEEPGSYRDTVRASITQGGAEFSSTADVIVEADRIAFISDREDEQLEIYTMQPDGTDVQRITRTPWSEIYFSWSPDGRRLALEDFNGVAAINDDGKWPTMLFR